LSKLLFIDTETGGLDPRAYSIFSLGAVVWEDGKLGDSFQVFIAEPNPVSEPEAMKVNRLDLNWLKENGVSPAKAIESFHQFLARNFGGAQTRDKIALAGHNVNFDVGFLRRLYSLADAKFDEVFSHRTLDTASVLRFLIVSGKVGIKDAGLGAALEFFKITVEDDKRHTALGDALATAAVLNCAIDLVKCAEPQDASKGS
jgi:DNA polymerase-3 subunit epsilon